jgi:mannose-6-phosphate isomerase-like protein (cupin superfamily)
MNYLTLDPLEPEVVKKVWGEEHIFRSAETCVKRLVYLEGGKSSLHHHVKKLEYFLIESGVFTLRYFLPDTGKEVKSELYKGQIILIRPGYSHELYCQDGGSIIEFSTEDDPSDSYRLNKSVLINKL